MAKKMNWEEIQNLPRVHVPTSLMARIRKAAKKNGDKRVFETGVDVIKNGLTALGY